MDREENQKRQEKLLKVRPQVLEQMMKIPGVVGVGIGLKEVGGEHTEEIVFKVFVKEKKKLSELKQDEVIPSIAQGFPTDVVKVYEGEKQDDAAHYRPVRGGIQITTNSVPVIDGAGTLGMVCTYNNQERTPVVLSNHHVLFGNGADVGSRVYQPDYEGDKDCCCCNCNRGNSIGKVIKGKDDGKFVDCAIATVEYAQFRKNYIEGIGSVNGVAHAVVGEEVRKRGRTTELTTGTVTDIYASARFGPDTYIDQISIKNKRGTAFRFSDGGDSGSMIVNSMNQVVGLLLGGNDFAPYYTYANQIANVIAALGITIGPLPRAQEALTETLPEEVVHDEIMDENPLLAKYKAILERTANGRAILHVINAGIQEILWLVNNNRACGAVWQRHKGPAFIQAYNDLGEHPDKPIPQEVEGVKLADLVAGMGDVLEKNGSDQLRWNIRNYQGTVMAFLPSLKDVNSIISTLEDTRVSCSVLNLIWQMIWNADSAFYLPWVFKEGLKIDLLHIDIPSLQTLHIGDLPKLTMFKEPVLGYMEIQLTDTVLKGLPTVQQGTYACTTGSDEHTTDITFSLVFDELNFSGNYSVSAGGGIGGCAIAAAAHILGGGGSLVQAAGGDTPAGRDIDQALWYRQPLAEHENGQLLIGAYYQDNPAVYDLVHEPGSLLAQSMKLADVKTTTEQVNQATTYYYDQQHGVAAGEGEAPRIGTIDQYKSGGLPGAYALAMANQKVKSGQDPDSRYARLAQHIIHFTGSVTYYQKKYPGTQPVGGEGGVLENIAKADPREVHDFVMNNGPYPVIDPESRKVVDHIEPEPLDTEALMRAYAMKAATWSVLEANGNTANGTFSDTGLKVGLDVGMRIKKLPDGSLQVAITSLKGSIGSLNIKLAQGSGWWPGLFDKVTNWIANVAFFQDLVKSHIDDGLNQDSVKGFLSEVINGALKKL